VKILFTGGSGLLGTHLLPLLKSSDGDGTMFKRVYIDAPTHKELDITQFVEAKEYDLIIHAAAFTDVAQAERDHERGNTECFDVNVLGTMNLAKAYPLTPFVFISSEYAHNPVNFYSITKFLGELVVNEMTDKCLIIRTLFKPSPFPWEKAFTDQYTQGDYVNIIARLIVNEIEKWNRKSKMIYVGTGRKTMYELALKTKYDVVPCSVNDIKDVVIPIDYL
jgi:dTDP-4-dehydrorhamnose reductase